MDELLGELDRACRSFRAKFPEEVLQDSLAGQLWFGAECLSAGSAILNREIESAEMRPIAKAVTKSLDNVRNLLRDQCLRNNIPNAPSLKLDQHDQTTETLYESLKIFDRLFAEFELLYVSAMVQVKSKHEHDIQQSICVLFSETLQRALKLDILDQEQVDTYDPSLMFSIPRLAIISGLIIFDKGPLNMEQSSDQLSEMFRPFRKLLIKMRDYLRTLSPAELLQLEKLLCTNEEISFNQSTALEKPLQPNDQQKNHFSASVKILDKCDTMIKSTENFYTAQTDEWLEAAKSETEGEVSLVSADCTTSGYFIPNANLGHLLQPNDAILTNNIISSDNQTGDDLCEELPSQDSGLGTGDKGSLDRSPDQQNSIVLEQGRCDENWINFRKTVVPSSSKIVHDRNNDKTGMKKLKKRELSSSDDTSSTSSSSVSSSPRVSAYGESKEVLRKIKLR